MFDAELKELMKKDGKYRYSLQFGMSSEEEIRAGELLESLGNKKSKVLIAALNEYVTNHPELESERCELRVSYQSIPMELLETKIRQLVEERLGSVTTFPQTNTAVPEQVEHVSKDIVDMLGDLELFQI